MKNETSTQGNVFEIDGVVQRYQWGKRGASSIIGELTGLGVNNPEVPFAEMWFGAHASFPSPIASGKTNAHLKTTAPNFNNLHSYLSAQSTAKNLPFLLKILSVGAPLSIQLHPDKQEAEFLHSHDRAHYPDSNHKPELAVALTEVELLCGVMHVDQMYEVAATLPSLDWVLRALESRSSDSGKVSGIFRSLFSMRSEERELIVRKILQLNPDIPLLKNKLTWIREALKTSAPSDPGLIAILLLTYLKLSPGECVFIAPGVPHAYLSGDLVECMASSDNVVRAGLTEKFIDVETFLRLFKYSPEFDPRLPGIFNSKHTVQSFIPPFPDFKLIRISGQNGTHSVEASGSSIVLVIEGSAEIQISEDASSHQLKKGQALFIEDVSKPIIVTEQNADIFIACSSAA